VAADQCGANLLDGLFGRRLADLMAAVEVSSACASVLATMKSTPLNPAAIMLLTALPPAPPTPITAIRGFMFLALALASAALGQRRR
jgi:hypothetical protein